ncbi:MAG: hypothetical protein J6A52_06600 [Bacilli bacterium]|nr:hypothetical protein [Bacilli bacterium]
MNNQMPYGFIPPQFGGGQNQSCQCNNQIKSVNERIQNIERQIRRLERRVSNLENNSGFIRPLPISNSANEDYPDNYMI